jgi:hypothetical protein
LSRVLCRMKRYTPSAWVSTHVLYSCVVTLGKVRRQVCDSLLLPKVTGFGVDFDNSLKISFKNDAKWLIFCCFGWIRLL